MNGPQVLNQGFACLMVQLLLGGGTDPQLPLVIAGLHVAGAFLNHAKHDLAHGCRF